MAVVKKWRVYIESTVLADWLHFESAHKSHRALLSRQVKDSYRLVNYLLEGKSKIAQPFTSYWAIYEALGAFKRTNIELWLVADGIPTSFYNDLKESAKYKLKPSQLPEIKKLIHVLTSGDKSRKGLRPLAEEADIDNGISLILEGNLEAPDSFHVGIALSYGCDMLVTRDHHYFRKGVKASQRGIEILRPSALVWRLQRHGEVLPS
jgi:hypothetical protein